jgi:hypothetical protein
MPMRNRVRKDYSRVWRQVCTKWLGWSEKRFERFVRAFDAKLAATDGANWFYHEPPLYHVVPLLVTDEFEEWLHKAVRRSRYGTPECVYFRSEILAAVEGSPKRQERFDWDAARERAEEHLALYREKFPSPKTVTIYENWVLSYYDPKLTGLLQAVSQ